MKRVRLRLYLSAIALCVSAPAAFTQSPSLREPDWNDEPVARANENLRTQLRNRTFSAPPPSGRELSLPRWGFGRDMRALDANESGRARSLARSTSAIGWPECAKADPRVTHVRDESGVWYTDNYDFGCITISIMGDRAFNPNLKLPGVAPRKAADNECDPGPARTARPARAKAHEGDQRRFELQLQFNRLPYTISGECLEGAEPFCLDGKAQCALVDRLILLGGSKE